METTSTQPPSAPAPSREQTPKSKFREEISGRLKAGANLCWVTTSESDRAFSQIVEEVTEITTKLRKVSVNASTILIRPNEGAFRLTDNRWIKIYPNINMQTADGDPVHQKLPTPAEWVRMMANTGAPDDAYPPEHWQNFRFPDPSYIIVSDADKLFSVMDNNKEEILNSMAELENACRPLVTQLDGKEVHALSSEKVGRQIIFLGTNPDKLQETLEPVQRYLRKINFPRPTAGEIATELSNEFLGREGVACDRETIESASEQLKGLTLVEAREAAFFSVTTTRKLDPMVLRHEVRRLIEKHPAITMPDFSETLDTLVGLDNAKEYFKVGLNPNIGKEFKPKAALISGIPGTGKSHLAKAIGNHYGLPTLQINMGRIFGSLVGQSERALDDMIEIIDSIGKGVFFFDEIEKALANTNGGDGGVSTRISGRFLNWMQDRENNGIILATSNDITKLSVEMTRQGRWSVKFFVDSPGPTELESIGRLYCDKWMVQCEKGYFSKNCVGWTGSEIRDLVQTAAMFGGEKGSLVKARTYVIPLVISDPLRMDEIRTRGKMLSPA